MAKQRPLIKIYDTAEGSLPGYMDITLITGNGKRAVFESPTSGDRVIVTGENFKYDDGFIDQGNVKSLTFIDDITGLVQKFSNFVVKAGQIAADNEIAFVNGVIQKVQIHDLKRLGSNNDDSIYGFRGDDLIFGGRGDDEIVGQQGRDRMVGGKGSDEFGFALGHGRDVITDFDFDGGDGEQDYINADYPGDIAIKQSGKNTIINFGDGDVVTLLGVKAVNIDETDFL